MRIFECNLRNKLCVGAPSTSSYSRHYQARNGSAERPQLFLRRVRAPGERAQMRMGCSGMRHGKCYKISLLCVSAYPYIRMHRDIQHAPNANTHRLAYIFTSALDAACAGRPCRRRRLQVRQFPHPTNTQTTLPFSQKASCARCRRPIITQHAYITRMMACTISTQHAPHHTSRAQSTTKPM